jgi:hypothetical protein
VGTGVATLLTSHLRPILAVAYAPDGHSLASAGTDGVRSCDPDAHRCRSVAQEGGAALAFAPDAARLAFGAIHGAVWEFPDDLPRDEAALRIWIADQMR